MTAHSPLMANKARVLILLITAEVLAMSLWFVSAAVLTEMHAEVALSEAAKAALSSAVQGGFVLGALFVAVSGVADRLDPRKVFAVSILTAGLANLCLLWAAIGSSEAVILRGITGFFLAGVYPVGMKIASGWGQRDRGFIVGLFIGGLTLGTAAPHLLAWFGGADWRVTVVVASLLSVLSAGLVMLTSTGPFHAKAPRFQPNALWLAWTDVRIRRAYGGYLGHMWELFIFWAWLSVALQQSFLEQMPSDDALSLSKLVTFLAVGAGAVSCVWVGWQADKHGKAELAIASLIASGICCLVFALSFGGPVWLVSLIAIVWGMAVIADSAQFSALVADFAPAESAGTLMAFQLAIGFLMTTITVQWAPRVAELLGWPVLMALLALGPVFAIYAMWGLRRSSADSQQQI